MECVGVLFVYYGLCCTPCRGGLSRRHIGCLSIYTIYMKAGSLWGRVQYITSRYLNTNKMQFYKDDDNAYLSLMHHRTRASMFGDNIGNRLCET